MRPLKPKLTPSSQPSQLVSTVSSSRPLSPSSAPSDAAPSHPDHPTTPAQVDAVSHIAPLTEAEFVAAVKAQLLSVEAVKAGRPSIHAIIYGETGTMKSTFAATFPKVQLVLMFDPADKVAPYVRYMTVQVVVDPFYEQLGIEALDCFDKQTGAWVRRIEFYPESDPENPSAWAKFEARAPFLSADAPNFGSVVLDSVTFFGEAYGRYVVAVNPGRYISPQAPLSPPDGRLIGLDVKSAYINQLKARFANLRTNVVLVGHASDKKDEFAEGNLRGIEVPGTLKSTLPTGFGETYHTMVVSTKRKGEKIVMLQTRHDGLWYGNSVVLYAPNPCLPWYEALWANYEG